MLGKSDVSASFSAEGTVPVNNAGVSIRKKAVEFEDTVRHL